MKRCLAIVVLSVFLITYLLPVATLVKADVVIGDNDEVIVNENAHILGRKLALIESIPNLLNSGVTEVTISNVNDLDEYLDYIWEELEDAQEYLISGDWANDISTSLRNEALENITNYINYVGDRENIFANLLRDPTTTLLKTYVTGNNLPKVEYKQYNGTLGALGSLSKINNGSISPQPNPNYQTLLDYINKRDSTVRNAFYFYNAPSNNGSYYMNYYPFTNFTWFWNGSGNSYDFTGSYTYMCGCSIQNLYITSNNGTYSINQYLNSINGIITYAGVGSSDTVSMQLGNNYSYVRGQSNHSIHLSSSGTLEQVLNYLIRYVKNVNIYVDNVPWSIVNAPVIPTLDIDGFLKIYGNDNPPTYDIQNGTQIDYDELYDTIYNAIINALPIDQQDITYYDSHDTVYSPTIINNYGSDSDGENDWIESILDYAIVPNFDTALVEPISEPITNGTVVMVTGVSVIPEDILFVLGAAFVLILFACIINRMIE